MTRTFKARQPFPLTRNFFLAIAILCISQMAYSQPRVLLNLPKYDQKLYHFGFILGVNQMFFSVKNVPEFEKMDSLYILESSPELGFNIGIVSNLRLAENWDLRFIPTLSFGERNLHYTFLLRNKQFYEDKKKIESTHIDLPFELKFKAHRLNNFRAYLLTGAKYSIDLASQAKKKENEEELRVKIERNDLAFEAGVGFDFYTTYFKFGTELKMSYGLSNLLKQEHTIYTRGIESLKSKIFQISFTFE